MNAPLSPPNPRRIITPGASWKEILLAVLGALLAIGLVVYAVVNLGNNSAQSSITGEIVEKKFVPREENRVTIGKVGVQRNDRAGQYYLSVKARKTGEIYHVLLSEEDFNRVQVGDDYQISKASLQP